MCMSVLSDDHLFICMSLAGDVIELYGSEGSGKSELLLNATAQCVLPKKSSGVLIGMSVNDVRMCACSEFNSILASNLPL